MEIIYFILAMGVLSIAVGVWGYVDYRKWAKHRHAV
jgi:hypothetical protein